jgi:hypothetical protein
MVKTTTSGEPTQDKILELVKHIKNTFPKGCTFECKECPLRDSKYETPEHAICELLLALTNASGD